VNFLFCSAAREFGGGERFLSLLVPELRRLGHSAALRLQSNAPSALIALQEPQDSGSAPHVVVFNGIGALYRWGPVLGTRFQASIYVHHTSLHDDQGPRWKARLRPLLLHVFSLNVGTIVRVCRASLADDFGGRRIVTVYNGVPVQAQHSPVRGADEPFVLAMIGSVNANKNQAAALQLLAMLPPAFHLKLIGGGPKFEELKISAQTLGVSERVQWTGFTKVPLDHLGACHCLLVLSKNEAFPFSALEALSVGVPVVSYDVGGLPELLGDGVGGVLVAAGQLASVRLAVLRLFEDEASRFAMATAGREKIAREFSLNTMATGFLQAAAATISRQS